MKRFKITLTVISVFAAAALIAIPVLAFIYGDINNDRMIDTRDSVAIIKSVSGQAPSIPLQTGDINGDGTIDAADALLIQQDYLGTQAFSFSNTLLLTENGSDRILSFKYILTESLPLTGLSDILVEFGYAKPSIDFLPLYDNTGTPLTVSGKADSSYNGSLPENTVFNATVTYAKSITNVPLTELCKDPDITFIARISKIGHAGDISVLSVLSSLPSERTTNNAASARVSTESVDMLGRLNFSMLSANDGTYAITEKGRTDVGIFFFVNLGNPQDKAFDIYEIMNAKVSQYIDPLTQKPYPGQLSNYLGALAAASKNETGYKDEAWGRHRNWDSFDDGDFGSYGATHYWSQPIWGYYFTTEKWVIAKQLEMFITAGIDYIAIDYTNGYTYSSTLVLMFEVYREYQLKGWNVPKFLFICGGSGGSGRGSKLTEVVQPGTPFYIDNAASYNEKNMADFMADAVFFRPEFIELGYDNLWYHLPDDPKPCIVCHQSSAPLPSSTTTARVTCKNLVWPSPGNSASTQSFASNGTERNKDDAIPWMDYHRPQWLYPLTNPVGTLYAMCVSPCQTGRGPALPSIYGVLGKRTKNGSYYNNETSMGRSYYSGNNMTKIYNQFAGYFNCFNGSAPPSFTPDSSSISDMAINGIATSGTRQKVSYYGINFEEQFYIAKNITPNPNIIMLTGWNTWSTGKYYFNGEFKYNNEFLKGVDFADLCDLEYSGDIEPMKGDDSTQDSYYLQMMRGIRSLKMNGVESNEIKPVQKASIAFGASNFTQWADKGWTYKSFENTLTATRHHRSLHVGDPLNGKRSYTDVWRWDLNASEDQSLPKNIWNEYQTVSPFFNRPVDQQMLFDKYGITMEFDPNDWDIWRPFFTDNSGRNDITECKVTFDSENVYFYVKTKDVITNPVGENWMNLLISTNFETTMKTPFDAEGVGYNTNTYPQSQPQFAFLTAPSGFGNYQFVINQNRNTTDKTVAVERFNGVDEYSNRTLVGNAQYELSGNEMHICIPRTWLGLDGSNVKFAFKWTDNITDPSDLYESYYKTGDSAPIGRTNYYFEQQ